MAHELQDELATSDRWMYPWRLTSEIETPLVSEHLRKVHEIRALLMEDEVRAALTAAGGDASGLDLACSEGWF